ncbi:hypothetical protein IG197_32935 (plasmid) [Aminobacter sp. SR38]|jgi:hypothetical protein|uniref:hypothetical protein n=1 Tax=Hyphomicrobiales TaxID=356 RepID=UPI00177DC7EC|nr:MULTISPECIES: hypothetical protein [Hyphomicrobiales]MCZ7497359.1 hypothetical protein [Rhizobium rhizogenes]MCZ7501852.1 hypothetical protein [Rhizobium rhizogenes]QOF75270.1 hypothetical protein IG197_32375 [Aminobacter sp. SR38]QOF75360.1 hypothetical protein IG197_32935 [Aminobacter sp. SR38]
MIDPETGLVISYHYLWTHQHDRGEESGRKARPACVVVPVTSDGKSVVIFPLTTKEPGPDRLAIKVPDTERKRLTLRGRGPTWLILDDANADVLPGSFHVEPVSYDPLTISYGKFSKPFMDLVIKTVANAIRARKIQIAKRKR